MEYYWEIVQFDGTRTRIPPEAVEVVKRRWDNGNPIHTSDMTIPANQIKYFRKTAEPYGQQPLLEAAAQAFDEPVLNNDGSIVCRWVKKSVTQHEYNKHYAAIPAYKRLGDDSSMIEVAMFLPVHQIDVNKLAYCSDDEVRELERGRQPHGN